MTKDEIEHIASAAAKEAVKELLLTLGIYSADPIRAQTDMATVRELTRILNDPEHEADQIHLRKWRVAMESASSLSVKAVIGVIVTGLLGIIWLGIQQVLGK